MLKEFPEGEAAKKMAIRWASMIQNAGVNVKCYAVGSNRILFTTQGRGVFAELKKFVLQQPETDYFEFNQQRFFPAGRTKALLTDEQRKRKEEEEKSGTVIILNKCPSYTGCCYTVATVYKRN